MVLAKGYGVIYQGDRGDKRVCEITKTTKKKVHGARFEKQADGLWT
jgi:hypothetical protein